MICLSTVGLDACCQFTGLSLADLLFWKKRPYFVCHRPSVCAELLKKRRLLRMTDDLFRNPAAPLKSKSVVLKQQEAKLEFNISQFKRVYLTKNQVELNDKSMPPLSADVHE